MICYHSTGSKSALDRILKGEMDEKSPTVWNVSDDDGCFYVWPKGKMIDGYGFEEDQEDLMISQAIEAGMLQTCCNDGNVAYVIELDIPDELLQDDYSCNNMHDVASFITCDQFDKSMVKAVYCKEIPIYYKPFILINVLDNPNFTDKYVPEDLLMVAESLQGIDICEIFEKINEIEIEKLYIIR